MPKFVTLSVADIDQPRLSSSLTLTEAAAIIGVAPRSLRKILTEEGGIRPQKRKGSPIRVPRTEVERIATAFSQSMSFDAVITYLGIGSRAVKSIREAELLPVWIHGGCSNKHRYLFVKTDVDRWVRSVVGDPVDMEALAPGELTISDVNRRTQMPFLRLVEAITQGDIAVRGRLANASIFGGVVVAKSEVLKAMNAGVGQEFTSRGTEDPQGELLPLR